MILFIGQVNSQLRHREAFQEVDYGQYLGSMAKWVAEIDCDERITEMICRAWSVATSGRPGPFVLVLPEADLLSMTSLIEAAHAPIIIMGAVVGVQILWLTLKPMQ